MEAEIQQPSLFEIRCALPGCRWRLLLPMGVSQEKAAHCLHHNGWRVDDESDGFICFAHDRAAVDA